MIMWIVMTSIVFQGPQQTFTAPIPPNHHPQPSIQDDQAPIIGFDCNQTEPEVLTISSLEVGKCPETSTLKPSVELQFGQLIQKHTIELIQIRTCQITKSTSYFRCAKNWYNYNVYPPSVGVVKKITSKACNIIHDAGIYRYSEGKEPWTDIEVNTTYHHAVNEIGWTDPHGYCQGGTIYLENKEHTDIVVQASYTLSIRESWAKVDMESGAINIENSLQCTHAKGSCFDAKTGTHVWTPTKKDCPGGAYRQLYKGSFNITKSTKDNSVLLTVNSPPFLFTSELGINTYACGMSLHMTEFPGIFYLPQKDGAYQGSFPQPETNDIEFITYLNSKITYTYHNLISSAQDMYLASIHKTCEVERQMLKNRIEIIRLNSQSGGLSTLLQEGMFARANGEVIHLLKCEPVAVTLRNSEKCHEALPITYNNENMFLLPNTHIISPYSPEIPCTPITPVTYKIGGRWWAYTGSFQLASSPTILKPQNQDALPFMRIRSFGKGGMYAIEQIEAVQKLMIFPTLREAISTDIASGLTRYYGKGTKMDLTSIMSDHDYENIAERNIKKFWGYFSSIGSTISGFIGIYFFYRLIKGVLTCFIDGKSLYKAFGCSLYLFSSIWSRLAIYFLQQAQTQNQSSSTPDDDDIEMTSDPIINTPQPATAPGTTSTMMYKSVYPQC